MVLNQDYIVTEIFIQFVFIDIVAILYLNKLGTQYKLDRMMLDRTGDIEDIFNVSMYHSNDL